MSLIVNLTKSDVAHSVGMGLDGRWQVTAVVKTSYVQFILPALAVPVTFVSSDDANEGTATVDTIIIEPEARRFSLVAKAQATLAEGPQSLDRIVVGELTRGMRQALEIGKCYPWSRHGRKPG